MRPTRRKLTWLAATCAALGLVAFALASVHGERRFRARLDEATSLLKAQRVDVARRALMKLEAERPGHPEVIYHLGVCEYARGNLNAASAAWARVPLDAPQGSVAGYYRARIAIPRGQFALAEGLLREAVRRPGPHAEDARWELVKLLRLEGRFDEARDVFLQGLREGPEMPGMIRMLYSLDVDPIPLEQLRTALEAASRQTPDDERVWLARAHLALVQGQLDESDRWLVRCERHRPGDAAVARMRLSWARAAGRPEVAWRAMKDITADEGNPETEVLLTSLAAWLARQGGDREAERRWLERLIALRPQDDASLERLAELSAEAGRRELVASYRKRRQETEPMRKRYEELLRASNPARDAAELERLARQLGRSDDRRIWLRFLEPGDAARFPSEARASGSEATGRGGVGTLLELLSARLDGGAPTTLVERPQAKARDLSKSEGPSGTLFSDDAESSGLVFTHRNGDVAKRLIPPVTGSGGVGLLDYDGDGWLDVFAVQSGRFPFNPESPHDGDRLFRNRGDGTWEDVTDRSGLATMRRGYGHGVAVGDYDNDGRPDLFVTRWRGYALYHNRGDGTFEDRTDAAGLGGERDWPTSAAFADLDNDGDLDLYVCHYMKWDEGDSRACSDPARPEVFHCTPINFPALPDHVFRNDGGRFVDVTESAGIRDLDGRGLGVLAADLNDDGRIDLFVANDMTSDYLFLNRGGLRFEEVAHEAGVAGNASGGYQAGMGVACGDLNRDGRPDLAVTNFYNEGTTYFESLGQELFADRSDEYGIRAPSRYLLGFGVAMLDANNDGWLDLISANGHVNDGRPSYPWKMPVLLLMGTGRGRMHDAGRDSGPPFLIDRLARGLAAGDLDNDGRIDALVQCQNDPLAYFHNLSPDCGHAVRLRLEGRASNRDGVGTRVRVRAGSQQWSVQRIGGGSYQSAGDPRLHIGLGAATRVDEIEVRWPSGRLDRFEQLEVDREYAVVEGEPIKRCAEFREVGPPRLLQGREASDPSRPITAEGRTPASPGSGRTGN